MAQEAVTRAGRNPAELYRRVIASTPPEPGVIAGLGETGGPDDAGLVRPYLAHGLR